MSFRLRMLQDALDFAPLPACGADGLLLRYRLLEAILIRLVLKLMMKSTTKHWPVIVHL